MIEAILGIVVVVIGVSAISIVTISILKYDERIGHCDYDCDRCPFPKCSDEQIGKWKELDLHNGTKSR